MGDTLTLADKWMAHVSSKLRMALSKFSIGQIALSADFKSGGIIEDFLSGKTATRSANIRRLDHALDKLLGTKQPSWQTRRCNGGCGETKPYPDFVFDKSNIMGFGDVCHICSRDSTRRRRANQQQQQTISPNRHYEHTKSPGNWLDIDGCPYPNCDAPAVQTELVMANGNGHKPAEEPDTRTVVAVLDEVHSPPEVASPEDEQGLEVRLAEMLRELIREEVSRVFSQHKV
jgi:hypothetical protein